MMYVFLVLTGIVSGFLGGMGMGGGTLLIPLLTLLFNFNQKIAQAINLIAFSIMAIPVLIIHIKNKLIDKKTAISFGIFAAVFSVIGALLANVINSELLRKLYAVMLICISIIECINQIKKINN